MPFGFGELWKSFLRGGYPELAIQPERNAALWHASYVQTYLERDVRMLRQIGDLTQHQNFLRVLAARSAQLLSLTDVARDLGVAVNMIKVWLSVFEPTYQVIVLHPYFAIGRFQRDMMGTARPGYLVHPGDVRLPLGPSADAIPFASL